MLLELPVLDVTAEADGKTTVVKALGVRDLKVLRGGGDGGLGAGVAGDRRRDGDVRPGPGLRPGDGDRRGAGGADSPHGAGPAGSWPGTTPGGVRSHARRDRGATRCDPGGIEAADRGVVELIGLERGDLAATAEVADHLDRRDRRRRQPSSAGWPSGSEPVSVSPVNTYPPLATNPSPATSALGSCPTPGGTTANVGPATMFGKSDAGRTRSTVSSLARRPRVSADGCRIGVLAAQVGLRALRCRKRATPGATAGAGSIKRSQLRTTSDGRSGLPSEKARSGRSRNVIRRPSSSNRHDSASAGRSSRLAIERRQATRTAGR